jgi:tight adherence protein C
MTPESVAVGLAMGLGLWTLWGALFSRHATPSLAERIAPALLDVSTVARRIHQPLLDDPVSIAGYVLSPTLSGWVTRLDKLLGGSETQRLVFDTSGRKESFASFRHNRVITASAGACAGVVVGAVVAGISGSGVVSFIILGGAMGALAGLGYVDYRLRAQARARAERISEEFPTVIELLGLALAAGDSLPRALDRVSSRGRGELGREWASVMAQVELGAPLAPTLRASAARLGSVRVIAFVEHLAQALERGAPLAEVVAAHSVDAKEDFSRSLVERAGKAEVRMLVPMVLLILPVTVIFAVYPGVQALQFEF